MKNPNEGHFYAKPGLLFSQQWQGQLGMTPRARNYAKRSYENQRPRVFADNQRKNEGSVNQLLLCYENFYTHVPEGEGESIAGEKNDKAEK